MNTQRSGFCPGCHRDVPIMVLQDIDHYTQHPRDVDNQPTLKTTCALSRQPVQMVSSD